MTSCTKGWWEPSPCTMTRVVQETAESPGKNWVWHSSVQFEGLGVAKPSTVYVCPNLPCKVFWSLRRIDCCANDSTSLANSNQFRKLQQEEKHPPTTPFRSTDMQPTKKSTSKLVDIVAVHVDQAVDIMKSSRGSC